MSTRCRCCNEPLNWIDLNLVKADNSPEDFCGVCRHEVNNIDLPLEREYKFQDEKEGIKLPYDTEHY